ncbi:hypothetical protein WJX84_009926 [Apatococcus fuscideae]|uniref:Uncharacterized protein n=1 Tax=Apatococcus fuscideae TaxID=2026836 RepID=A0AAW1S566_9CHLO
MAYQQPYGQSFYAQQPSYGQQASSSQGPAVPYPPAFQQPNVYVPQPQSQGGANNPAGFMGAADPFMTGIAGNVLQQSSETYFRRGQAFVQSRMGFLSTGALHYYFNISSDYVRNKLLMLMAPFLRRFDYNRKPEQISGGHKYMPPRQDVNAPDMYIPLMALCTYCILGSVIRIGSGRFTPDSMYGLASSGIGAWILQLVIFKVLLFLLSIPGGIPTLEVACYSGYAFVPVCFSMVASMLAGRYVYWAVWAYGALCMAIFSVRTMKRILYQEAHQFGAEASLYNYLLLGLGLFQFPLTAWLAVTR